MFKNIIPGGIGVLTAVLMLGSTAEAGTGTIGGLSVSSCYCTNGATITLPVNGSCPSGYVKKCSVDLISALEALGNLTRAQCLTTNDPATDCAAIHAANLYLTDGFFGCFNPANNAFNAKGVPFKRAQLNASDIRDADSISQNGSANTLISFADADIVQAELDAGAFDVKKKGKSCPAGYTDLGNGFCRPTSASLLCKEKWIPVFVITELQAFSELFTKYQGMSACDVNAPVHDGYAATNGCASIDGEADGNCHLKAVQGQCPDGYQKIGNLCYQACARPDALSVQCFTPTPTPTVEGFVYVGANNSPPCDTLCHNDAIAPTGGQCPSGYTLEADGLCHAQVCPLAPAVFQ